MNLLLNKLSLNGTWDYITDPTGEYSNYQIKTSAINGTMYIPQNWQSAGLNNYNGSVWFIKNFDYDNIDAGISILKFYGIDYFADVWLNDNYLGDHKGYFQHFYFNVTPFVKQKDNTLIVKVTSPREDPEIVWPLKKKLIKGIFNHHDCRPGGWDLERGQDQNTGGIWNKVELLSTENIYLDHIKITPKLNDSSSEANVLAELYCESSLTYSVTDEFIIKLKTPSDEVIILTSTKNIKSGKNKLLFSFRLDNPRLWWSWDTGEQNIYSIEIASATSNSLQTEFGIKEVKLDNNSQFFLNHKRLFLRGTNIIPTQFLSELSADKIKMQVSLMKEANVNIVRIHAHVNRKEFFDECDRQGILVWQDFALQWTYDESPEFMSDACEQIKDMVRLHYNHPSIAFWCCHNEPGEQINSLDPFLYDSVLSEDNTRIIRKASNYEEHPYDGWYWGKADHFEAAPMGPLVTEFGAQGIPHAASLNKFIPENALYTPDWQLWKYHNFQYIQTFLIAGINKGSNLEELIENSQNYQAELLRTAVDSYRRKKNSGITGIFQFMFIDCWPSITWSVIDYFGVKKKAFEVLKQSYQPVYLSIKVRQQKYFSGDKLNIDMWLINDTYLTYKNACVKIRLDNEILWKMENILISEDSIIKYDWEKINIVIPENLCIGEYVLSFLITDEPEGKEISFNKVKIEILKL